MFNNFFFFENRVVEESSKYKNIVPPDRPKIVIWRMRIACWIRNAANTQSEYVILTAFPLQQWLHESASMVHYTCTAYRYTYKK
jgi:hypothetical protein